MRTVRWAGISELNVEVSGISDKIGRQNSKGRRGYSRRPLLFVRLTILSLCLINQLVAAFFTVMTARCRLTHKSPKVRVRRCGEICPFFVTNRT